ncbi:hypothetical protein [Kitasatospora sp. NPDC094015]|uniref:hypothetical protein n=1 Tax=Kitasatospora sp. NPDC094015 TaxID=3155205 RepID=UPI0033243002
MAVINGVPAAVRRLARRPGAGARTGSPPQLRTPGRLRHAAVALVLCTAASWGAISLAVGQGQAVVGAAGSRTIPAVMDTGEAAYRLADADRVASAGFASGAAALTGPGRQYQDDLKSAHQALARVAEHGTPGAGGGAQLETVAGLLVEYSGLIAQAHATEGSEGLSSAYLGYASQLMHRPGDGILARIEQLRAGEREQLARQRRSAWTAPLLLVAVLAPAVLGLLLLVRTQLFLRRHFNRRINPCLLAATVLLATLAGWTATSLLGVDSAFARTGDREVPRLAAAWQVRTAVAAAAGNDTAAVVRGEPAAKVAAGFYQYSGTLTDREITSELVDRALTRQPDFRGALADLLLPDLAVPVGPGVAADRETALHTLRDYRAFVGAHNALQLGAATGRPGLAQAAAGASPEQLGGAHDALDLDLAAITDLGKRRLAEGAAAARPGFGLPVAVPVLCAAIAVLCGLGLWPRIEEYRAVTR